MTEFKEHGGYVFYSDCRVWSTITNKFVSCNHGKNWYPKIEIEGKRRYVHRIVADLFIPNPLGLKYINHKDGNKSNFSVSNLERVTCSQNIKHAFDMGLNKSVKGQDHYSSKLTNRCVSIIKEAIANGHQQKDIAKYYRLATSTISRINTGKKWKHLL